MMTQKQDLHQKPWTQAELKERLERREFTFAPVQLRWLEDDHPLESGARSDGIVEISWQGKKSQFVLEYKPSSTPKFLESAMDQVQQYAKETHLRPLVIVPYLSESSLQQLEAKGVSGLDLSGNGVLLAPQFAVRASGNANRFRDNAPIRNIFWGNSSLLCRCFLLQPNFASLTALREFALSRLAGGQEGSVSLLTKGTVSKVIQALEEQKIIIRSGAVLKLADSETLLEHLKVNYRKPLGRRLEGKMPLGTSEAWERLAKGSFRAVVTGDSSAGHYRVLSGQDKLTLYVDDLERASECLEVSIGPLFPNIELIEEQSVLFYFDARLQENIRWASPIQTWLELSHSGPREREAAQQLQPFLRKGEGAMLS